MHPAVFYAAVIWTSVLLGVGVVRLATARSALSRIVTLDMVALVVIALLVLFAGHRVSPHFLDAALVLALLSFGATLAAARFHEGRLFR